jgi:hypothetical protein
LKTRIRSQETDVIDVAVERRSLGGRIELRHFPGHVCLALRFQKTGRKWPTGALVRLLVIC